MTVLHVADMCEGGGAEEMFRATVEGSRSHGFTTLVHIADRAPGPLDYVFSWREASRLLNKLRETQPDVIHLQNYYHRLTPSVLWAVRRYRKQSGTSPRLVFTAHDHHIVCPNSVMQYFSGSASHNVSVEENPVRLLRRYDRRSIVHAALKVAQWTLAYRVLGLHREFDIVIAPSEFLANTVTQRVPAEVVVVRNLIDSPAISTSSDADAASSDQPEPGGPMRLVFIGRVEPEKGADLLIEVFSALPPDEYSLDIYGDGSLLPVLQDHAARNGWGSRVTFHGRVARDKIWGDVPRYADAVIVPSTCYETASLSMLEAAAFGVPTLGNALGALPESAGLSTVSAVCNIADPDEVIAALETLRGKRGRNALKNPEAFTKEAYHRALKAAYTGDRHPSLTLQPR